MSTDARMAAVVAAALAANLPVDCYAHITPRDASRSRLEVLGDYDCVFFMGPKPVVGGAEYRVALYADRPPRVDRWNAPDRRWVEIKRGRKWTP